MPRLRRRCAAATPRRTRRPTRSSSSFPTTFRRSVARDGRRRSPPAPRRTTTRCWCCRTGSATSSPTPRTSRPATATSAIEAFLENRVGYCEQFAGTFAAMARSLGIPARVAVGFTQGEQQPDGTLRGARPQRPRLAGGLVRRPRLGAVRADPGARAARRRGVHRGAAAAGQPAADRPPRRRPRRPPPTTAPAPTAQAGSAAVPPPARPRRRRPTRSRRLRTSIDPSAARGWSIVVRGRRCSLLRCPSVGAPLAAAPPRRRSPIPPRRSLELWDRALRAAGGDRVPHRPGADPARACPDAWPRDASRPSPTPLQSLAGGGTPRPTLTPTRSRRRRLADDSIHRRRRPARLVRAGRGHRRRLAGASAARVRRYFTVWH